MDLELKKLWLISSKYHNSEFLNTNYDPKYSNDANSNQLSDKNSEKVIENLTKNDYYIDPTDDLDGPYEKIKLQNINNSCYVNSIMQIILHNHTLFKRFKEHFGNQDMLLLSRSGYCDFAKIDMNAQCSAESFLHWLLEQPKKNKGWLQSWNDIKICSECQNKIKTQREEHIWRVYPVKSDPYIDDKDFIYEYEFTTCIYNQSSETIDLDCDKCNKKTSHNVANKISKLRENIFFTLQNFNNKNINIYESIQFSDKYIYDLNAIVQYQGNSYFGHYTVYVLDSNGWYHYNDNKIKRIEDIHQIIRNRDENTTFPILWYVKNDEDDVEQPTANEA